ncbi:MAG: DNA polymerase III subunit gamma/tau [Endomicrobiales bacterium]
MAYVVLARRFRPQGLDQVIGQEHVSRTLKNAIAENRVAHAYLFSGPRGVGKTTAARILAKALNCKNGPTAEPCGTCANCVEIVNGSSVDVQEIDGASNRGIDEIRALRENVKFAPAASKYKIYIIDEAHQITDAAFNALLKTLEEPPDHVVFILATTEPQKIPVTILSRCQRYRFRLLSAKEITGALEKIIQAEGFEIDPAALQVIVTSSGGSMRDALSLLDQAISFVSGKITSRDMQSLLGFLPRELITAMTAALAGRDLAKVLSIIKEVSEQGYNLLQFGRDLRDHLRHVLLNKVNPETLEVTADEVKVLESQKELFSTVWLIRSGHLISKALDEMRWADQPRLILELYLLKLAQPYAGIDMLVERLDKLEKNLPYEEPAAPRKAAPEVREEAPARYQAAPETPATDFPASLQAETAPAQGEKTAASAKDVSITWDEVASELQQTRPIIGSVLSEVAFEGSSGNSVTITVKNKFQQESLKRNQALIEDLLEKKAGRRYGLKLLVNEKLETPQKAAPQVIEAAPETEGPSLLEYQVEGDLSSRKGEVPPGLEKLINKFPGKIVKKKQ